MMIHFRTHSKARVTEYLSVEAPANWAQMGESEKLKWLADNLDAAAVRGAEAHNHEDTVVLDFEGS